jgi:UDP-N-acetylglucosamine diphosphorylase / glucose-1-phosphate thymidylyltransferase / UDP-N-acetylgalactosamine diphosphorylase / glucosamine-1-phosphate N-acetyltransferase / galactosamine-1-phosphate N-acetyltransferase
MRIAFFEDDGADGFAPIALTRPVFELICGQFSLRERLIRFLDVHEWGVFIRPYLEQTYREFSPEAFVNDCVWLGEEPTLLINARWLPTPDAIEHLSSVENNVAGFCGDTLAFLLVEPFESSLITDTEWAEPLLKIAGTRGEVQAAGKVASHPWNLIDFNSDQLKAEFRSCAFSGGQTEFSPQIAVLGDPQNVFVSPSADIDPFVVIDARSGPVSIDAGAKVQAYTRIEGPCHIGFGSQLFRANVKAGTTIGPVCRVGGEIENSILHGYANKYHDGFLGHGYVCPWVNMGALSTNSDLKNDYSTVRVPLSGEAIDSGSTKVGCFIGDHSKTAVCSLFNTGTSIGVMTMLLPGGELLPKFLPSFGRVWHGSLDDNLNLEAALDTARTAMDRRGQNLTLAQERLLRHLYEATREQRKSAIVRQRARQVGLSVVGS